MDFLELMHEFKEHFDVPDLTTAMYNVYQGNKIPSPLGKPEHKHGPSTSTIKVPNVIQEFDRAVYLFIY